jgi:hypothetical protein
MRHNKYSHHNFTNLKRQYTCNHRAISEHQATDMAKKIYGLIDVNNRLVHIFDSFGMRNIDQ